MSRKSAARAEALQAMIESTKAKCMRDGQGLCAYFLEMAAEALKEDTTEVDLALRVRMADCRNGETGRNA